MRETGPTTEVTLPFTIERLAALSGHNVKVRQSVSATFRSRLSDDRRLLEVKASEGSGRYAALYRLSGSVEVAVGGVKLRLMCRERNLVWQIPVAFSAAICWLCVPLFLLGGRFAGVFVMVPGALLLSWLIWTLRSGWADGPLLQQRVELLADALREAEQELATDDRPGHG